MSNSHLVIIMWPDLSKADFNTIFRNKNFDYSIYPIFPIIIGSRPSVTLEMQLFISFQWTSTLLTAFWICWFLRSFFPTMERSQVAYMRWWEGGIWWWEWAEDSTTIRVTRPSIHQITSPMGSRPHHKSPTWWKRCLWTVLPYLA